MTYMETYYVDLFLNGMPLEESAALLLALASEKSKNHFLDLFGSKGFDLCYQEVLDWYEQE